MSLCPASAALPIPGRVEAASSSGRASVSTDARTKALDASAALAQSPATRVARDALGVGKRASAGARHRGLRRYVLKQ